MSDPVTVLRDLADDIESGRYGEVKTVAIAMLGHKFEIFGAGEDSSGASLCLMFNAGGQRLTRAIERPPPRVDAGPEIVE